MISLPKFILFCSIIVTIKPIFSWQFYDKFACNSKSQYPGSNYLCITENFQCQTYIIYRAQKDFQSLSSISLLFNLNESHLQEINNITSPDSSNLTLGREVIIPITCSCPDRYSRAIFMYNLSESESFDSVACEVFEGLVKSQVLMEENPNAEIDQFSNVMIKVPIKCACVSNEESENGIKYLVTYPVMEKDNFDLMAEKFGVSQERVWNANKIGSQDSIFPQTTLIIPTMDFPSVNWNIASTHEHPQSFSPGITIPLNRISDKSSVSLKSFVFLGVIVLAVVFLILLILAICLSIWRMNLHHHKKFQPLSARSYRLSNFSANFLDGMSKLKHSLTCFTLEELRSATEDFSESSVLGTAVYRGKIGTNFVAIEQMNSEEAAHHVINILTKINHLNIVKLEGYCCGTNPYLVFEYAAYGSLKDCLANEKMARNLTWKIRMQIAFDLAVGIHYIHFCTKPSYVHRNINSRNVLITTDLRAKISGFRLAKPLISIEDKEETNWTESEIVGRKGYLANEYLNHGQASPKIDIYAFGVILLELLSAREAIKDGNLLKDSVRFLDDGGIEDSSGCLEKMKAFMDPRLLDAYPLGDAVCLALLAKACVDEDHHHRPTMNDVLKALSRIV